MAAVMQPERRLLVTVYYANRLKSALTCAPWHLRVIAPRGHTGHIGYGFPLRLGAIEASVFAHGPSNHAFEPRFEVLQSAVFIDAVCTIGPSVDWHAATFALMLLVHRLFSFDPLTEVTGQLPPGVPPPDVRGKLSQAVLAAPVSAIGSGALKPREVMGAIP